MLDAVADSKKRLEKGKADMGSMCNGVVVQQQLESGILGGPKQIIFNTKIDGNVFTISVSQYCIRTVEITSSVAQPIENYWTVFNYLDCLLMMFDGKFIPIRLCHAIVNNGETASSELSKYIENRVGLYKSADFVKGGHSSFVDYDIVLTEELFQKWLTMKSELDITHQMVLYSMADTSLPIDCKCAFLIESFEALAELVKSYNQNYVLPTVKKGESKLGKRLTSILDLYGIDIFKKELDINRDKLVEILVNSRNRIAHIKSRQEKNYLNGPESVLYAVKLSYLYRTVLLSLLDIGYSLYSVKLKKSIESWNSWNGVLDIFLKKLT